MAVPASLLARLEAQLEALDLVLAGATPAALDARPRPEEWSARENLAHLARHHAVLLDRLRRLLTEDRPALGRYRAEDDPEWAAWAALPLEEILGRLGALRAEVVAVVRSLSPAESARTGLHRRSARWTSPDGSASSCFTRPITSTPPSCAWARRAGAATRPRRSPSRLRASCGRCGRRAPEPRRPEAGAASGRRRDRSSPGPSSGCRRTASSRTHRPRRSHGSARRLRWD